MKKDYDAVKNYMSTRQQTGYVPRKEATPETYAKLGFKSGLEVHQQLKSKKKLFCRCPAGLYQQADAFNVEVVRHMRPTLSELGEYDGTALMEFKTKKNIIYRIKDESSCTYEFDDTPPFRINPEGMEIAIEIALLLKTNIVGELHITRKQYLDGSIPTGFQRTAIVGIEGEIPLKNKKVRIIQLSIEEDSCREVSDVGHWRIYTTDRLGIPLTETVTYPDMLTPDEVAEAGQYIRFLARSTGKVNTGIGAAREDVNVSIDGGTRVEIKGVAHIKWIPELTHNEGFRQRALLDIRDILRQRLPDPAAWKMGQQVISPDIMPAALELAGKEKAAGCQWVAINLPAFGGILSFFTQPEKSFANELSDRLKVIACIEKPHMIHSEPWDRDEPTDVPADCRAERSFSRILNGHVSDFSPIKKLFKAGDQDAQLVIWGPVADIATALDTIDERCRLAFERVPNETRKSFSDGTTVFERVLPGPDRMYPDTDSAPIPIEEAQIQAIRQGLPREVVECYRQMVAWGIPEDAFRYILKRNLFPLIEKIVKDFNQPPRFTGTLIGQHLKYIEGQVVPSAPFDYRRIFELVAFIIKKKLKRDILKIMLPVVYEHPNMDFESVLTTIGYRAQTDEEILEHIPVLREKFRQISKSKGENAEILWIMGQLRGAALGNMGLEELRRRVEEARHD